MQPTDITLISELAQAVRDASPVAKDPEAAQLITQLIGSQPDALYFLVQTVLVQKQALQAQAAAPAGSGQPAFPAAAAPAASPAQPRGLFGRLPGSDGGAAAAGGGSSFLKTAAAGAAGAAGGLLVAQGISSLFRGGPGSEHGGLAGSYDEDPEEGWDDDTDWG
ncbi:DUF2076 family protein [Pseudolysinimonas sp.]|uniref:DUF2076 family protein n=1 Tax=Pseudolysinimonas sp. TaxID=2680009 RepID=UPI003F7DE177